MRNLLSIIPLFAEISGIIQGGRAFNHENAKLFSNTLKLLMPDKRMQATAFEDYHPSVFYAIEGLNNTQGLIAQIERTKELLSEALEAEDIPGFESILKDNIEPLSKLKYLICLPASSYPAMADRIRMDARRPIHEDTRTNTHFGSIHYNEGVAFLIKKIQQIEKQTGFRFRPTAKGAYIGLEAV